MKRLLGPIVRWLYARWFGRGLEPIIVTGAAWPSPGTSATATSTYTHTSAAFVGPPPAITYHV